MKIKLINFINLMYLSLISLLALAFLLVITVTTSSKNLWAVQPIDSLLLNKDEPVQKDSSHIQVRILLQLEPQSQVNITSVSGKKVSVFRPTDNIVHMIRASVNETSQFYIEGWHIENQPISFDQISGIYSSKLSFYKILDNSSSDVEELVGSTIINGTLEKQDKNLYNLVGENITTISNKDQNSQLNVIAGIKDTSTYRPNIAKGAEGSQRD